MKRRRKGKPPLAKKEVIKKKLVISKINDQKIEFVVITAVSQLGEVEGEIITDKGPENLAQKTSVKFNDHPPVTVGDRILARILTILDPETNLPTLVGKYIRKTVTAPEKIIGVFKNIADGAVLIPTQKTKKEHFKVEQNTIKALDGDLVEAQLTKKKRNGQMPSVKLIRTLGDPRKIKLASMISIHEHGIPNEFSEQVSKYAIQRATIAVENPTNLTELPFISIDPSDAKDHDDAIYASVDPDNPSGYIVWVAIADVAKYVSQGSSLDSEALRRGNSTYFPDLVVPMIPDALSSNTCSLKAGEVRAAIVVKVSVDKMGHKTSHRFFRSIIKNRMACSYEDVQRTLDESDDYKTNCKLKKLLKPIHAVYKLLAKKTKDREPLELDLIEQDILFDSNGEVSAIRSRERLESHKIIEEFMILANICAAETIRNNKLSFLYRIHRPPSLEKLLNLRTMAKSLGVNLNIGSKITGSGLNNLLKKAKLNNVSELVSITILRAMSQAHYSPENQGHFGLNLPCYTHFTSPIRRYSDILIHRALIYIHNWDPNPTLNSQAELVKIGEQLSTTERRSMLAERDTKDRYLAAFLTNRIGGEFSARINGLSKSGIFVRLDETGADGLIPLSYLFGDRYRLNDEKNKLIGRSSKNTFNIGANVLVKLKKANPISGGLIFELIQYKNKVVAISTKSGRGKKKLKTRKRRKKSV